MQVEKVSNDEYGKIIAEAHFQIEPDMQKVFRLLPADPLKLLEVNEDTPEVGVVPVVFPARVKKGKRCPSIIITEITPDEFSRLQKGELKLPEDWQIGEEYPRPALDGVQR